MCSCGKFGGVCAMHAEERATELLNAYSAALDEVWLLRQALAYEAGAIEADLGYKTFPKSRRAIALERVERLQAAARGEAQRAYAGISSTSLRGSMRRAGASETLTRSQFEAEQPRRAKTPDRRSK